MFVFNKNYWVRFPLKSSCYSKIFMSIQIVGNVWESFEVLNLDIFGLQWTLAAYFSFIKYYFPIKIIVKVAYTSLVYVAEISFQSKMLWVYEKHFSRRGFNPRSLFCNFFVTFWHLKAILHTHWVIWMKFSFANVFTWWFWIIL